MTMTRKVQLLAVAAAAAFTGFAAPAAQAEDRQFSYSFNIGATSDYRFRGMSQTDGDPAVQGGADFGYGIAYAGIWASNVDFGPHTATAEVDLYAGIKPVTGPVTWDLGVIYYTYPSAHDGAGELNYVELKAGASGNITKDLSVGATFYWSPDGTGEIGDVYTIEGTASYSLPKVWVFDPSISGGLGYTDNPDNNFSYTYWNAGLTLAVDKFALDFRYVDTDLDSGTCGVFKCDAAFIASVKVTLP